MPDEPSVKAAGEVFGPVWDCVACADDLDMLGANDGVKQEVRPINRDLNPHLDAMNGAEP